MTMAARTWTVPGTWRGEDLGDLLAAAQVRAPAALQAAEVDDRPTPARAAARPKASAARRSFSAKSPPPRAHRVHEVVGGLDAGQGVRQRLGAQHVAADDLDAVRQLGPRGVPHEGADVVPGVEQVGRRRPPT